MKKTKFIKSVIDTARKIFLLSSVLYLTAEVLDITVPEKYESKVFHSVQKYPELQKKVNENIDFLKQYGINELNVKTRDTSFLSTFLFNRKDVHAFVLFNHHYINFPLKYLSEEINSSTLLKEHLNVFKKDKDKEMVRYINEQKSQELLFNLFLNLDTKEGLDFFFFHEVSHVFGKKIVSQYIVDNNLTDKYSDKKLSSMEEAFCDVQGAIFVIKKNNLDKKMAIKFMEQLLAYRYSSKSIIYNMTQKDTTHDSTYALYRFISDIDKYWEAIKTTDLNKTTSISMNVARQNFAPQDIFEEEDVEEKILNVSLKHSYIYKLRGEGEKTENTPVRIVKK